MIKVAIGVGDKWQHGICKRIALQSFFYKTLKYWKHLTILIKVSIIYIVGMI